MDFVSTSSSYQPEEFSKDARDDVLIELQTIEIDDDHINNPLSDGCLDVIRDIAASGTLKYNWKWLRNLYYIRLYQNTNLFFLKSGYQSPSSQSFSQRQNELLFLLTKFPYEPPFTIQRLSEVLLLGPDGHQYRSTQKYLNSIEKLLMVSSTMSPSFAR